MSCSPLRRSHDPGFFVLLLLLLTSAAFTVGLTFAPCYSSMCVERYFPYQARIHVALYYSLIACLGVFLAARRFSRSFCTIAEHHVSETVVILAGKRLSVGAALLSICIVCMTFGSTGYWYPAEDAFWNTRGLAADWTQYMFRMVWTGVTGHWCDVLIGLVLIPVGRNSLLNKAFHLDMASLLFAHQLLAYTLCMGSLIHGFWYYSFLAAWVHNVHSHRIMQGFDPDNPLLTWKEGLAGIPYAWFNLPTGAIAGIVLIPVMAITSLPALRRLNYNVFYFIHVIFAVFVIVLVCLHASTNFYTVLPGLLLWLFDWVWRVRHGLGTTVEVQVQSAGNGWYRICLPVPLRRVANASQLERANDYIQVASPKSPLKTYYVNIRTVSRLQCHPFTAVYRETVDAGPVLLFQKSPERKAAKRRDREWTWRLAMLADQAVSRTLRLQARIEGPYSCLAPGMFSANCVLVIAGGTGITGALALADWWVSRSASELPQNSYFQLIWTVKRPGFTMLREIDDLRLKLLHRAVIELRIHLSQASGRLKLSDELEDFFRSRVSAGNKVWIYLSGPEGLLADAESAVVRQRAALRRSSRSDERIELDYEIARFTV